MRHVDSSRLDRNRVPRIDTARSAVRKTCHSRAQMSQNNVRRGSTIIYVIAEGRSLP